mgnify:CR=1 FL=1
MNRRLIRALQRGGVAAQTQENTWGVWRSKDRRGRIIGTLNGAEVEVLRLRRELKPLGAEANRVLTWAGSRAEATVSVAEAPDLERLGAANGRSLLETLIANCVSQALRSSIRKACQSFMADLESVDRVGHAKTMNWDALGQPRSAKGQRPDPGYRPLQVGGANARLEALHSALGDDDLRFLMKLVVREASRTALAKYFALRPVLAEQRGMALLRRLVAAYGA